MDAWQMPIGLAMELAQDPQAMKFYAMLPREAQAAVLKQAHGARSPAEMHRIVSAITKS